MYLSYPGRPLFGRLRVACGVLALAGVLLAGQTVQAAGPSIEAQVANALNSATSYQMKIAVSSSGSTYHIILTVVGTGAARELYLQATGNATTFNVVTKGTSTCISLAGQWMCSPTPMTQITGLLSFNPSEMLHEYGSSFHFIRGSTKTINGQQAVGYTFLATSPSIGTSKGTLWIAPKTSIIIEEDASITSSLITGSQVPYTIKLVTSHWNDPKLTIPNVPGL